MYKILFDDKELILSIEEIIKVIKQNPKSIFYKFIDGNKIRINNKLVLECQFICHRINTINELNTIDPIFGVEIDLRDRDNEIILSHDPFINGEMFTNYIQYYNKSTLILNIKSERIEYKCMEILKKYNITNYFFLDSSIPIIYLLGQQYNFASRYSEFEPIELSNNLNNYINYIWIDCFTKLPNLKINFCKKVCIVSPELQKRPEDITNYRTFFIDNNFSPDAICCKSYNIINWI